MLATRPQVRVDAERDGRIGMTHRPADVDDIRTLADQERGKRMPQIVEARPWLTETRGVEGSNVVPVRKSVGWQP
jgi:hypothetical protein